MQESPKGPGIGNPGTPRPADRLRAVEDGVTGYLAAGGAVLALHLSIGSLPEAPAWSRALGGRWQWGRSGHPDLGTATVHLSSGHPVVTGPADIVVDDERYFDLDVADDGSGHDVRSFDSAGHVAFLARAVRWLLREI